MKPGKIWRMAVRILAMTALVAGAVGLAAQDDPSPPARPAMVLEVEGAISPATAGYILRGLDKAAEQGAPMVVLRMDTPGGLDTSMREIVRAILASPVPVATWVAPSGSRAASAGTYILYASHVAAMAPATNLGSATPVSLGGGGGERPAGERERDRGFPFGLGAREQPAEETAAPAPEAGTGAGDETRADDDALSDTPSDTSAESRDTAATGTTRETGDAGNAGDGRAPPRAPASAMEAKVINDAVAYIRGLAELRGRNADWAEDAVRRAENLTAHAAAEKGVIDFVAGSLDELFAQADGRSIDLAGQTVVLETEGLGHEVLAPDWRTALLSIIANPNVALILMLVGIYGLIFEFLNPGVLVPGTIGGISLLLGLYSLALLPINYAGAGLILLGLALIVAEAFAPSFGILGIGGTAAMVLGAVILIDTDVPGMGVSVPLIAGVAVAGLIATMVVARLATRSVRARVVSGAEEMVGMQARVDDWQGAVGHVWVHGERWKAQGPADLEAGEMVRVAGLSGLMLTVARDNTARPG